MTRSREGGEGGRRAVVGGGLEKTRGQRNDDRLLLL